MSSSFRFALLLCTLTVGAQASFSKFSIPGKYEFVHGARNCAPAISIGRRAHLQMSAGDVDYTCAEEPESLTLTDSVEPGGNQLTEYLKGQPNVIGTFTVGELKKDINCSVGNSAFFMKEPIYVNFFFPKVDHNFQFARIFVAKAENSSHSGESHAGHTPHSARFTADGPTQSAEESHSGVSATNTTTGNETVPVPVSAPETSSQTTLPTTTTLNAGLASGARIVNGGFRYMSVGKDCLYRKLSSPACFPASSTVRLASGNVVNMSQLRVGDMVQTGSGKYSPVFMWTHRDEQVVDLFLRITTASGNVVTLTDGHYIYADGNAIPAALVRVGMEIRLGDGSMSKVVRITDVLAKGLYNPQTMDGDIVVDAVIASTYTTAVKPDAAHALLAPVRYMYNAFLAMGAGTTSGMDYATVDQ